MLVEALIAVPLVGAAVVAAAPNEYAERLALGVSAVPLVGSLYMYLAFDGSGNALLGGDVAYETFFEWLTLGPYAVNYHVGLDGISLPLVVMTTVLTTLSILSAWTPIDDRQRQFYGLMLFMEAALVGVFAALDFLLWFVFWEAVLVPMYFLIGVLPPGAAPDADEEVHRDEYGLPENEPQQEVQRGEHADECGLHEQH